VKKKIVCKLLTISGLRIGFGSVLDRFLGKLGTSGVEFASNVLEAFGRKRDAYVDGCGTGKCEGFIAVNVGEGFSCEPAIDVELDASYVGSFRCYIACEL
jgi:hypothetical protein